MADGVNFNVKLDRRALDFFRSEAPEKLKEARKRAVEAAGMIWSDETKQITRDEGHVDTSLYINSIGYVTNMPSTNKSGKGERNASQADVIYNLEENQSKTTLKIGSNVEYAEDLEKRYHLMARGLDVAKPRIRENAERVVKNTLGL